MAKTLVAVYRDGLTGQRVVEALLEAGFSGDDISLMVKDANGALAHAMQPDVSLEEGAELGALVGALVGIGSALIPAMGPLIETGAVGIIVTAGIGAAAGALTGGVAAGLFDLGLSEAGRAAHSEVRGSGTTVSLTTNDQWLEWAERIMRRFEPLKFEEREARWHEREWAFHLEDQTAPPDRNGGSLVYDANPPIKRVKRVKIYNRSG